MPPLASRLSSPQEFYKRLSSPIPFPSEEFGLQEFTRRHTKRHGHLPVQEQISCVLADCAEDRLRYRHKEHAPLVPRRKALPPSVPLSQPLPRPVRAQAPTPVRTATPHAPRLPLQCRISAPPLPGFSRINPKDSLAIIESKVNAVLTRLQAIFDRKDFLINLPAIDVLAVQHIADQLEWIATNLDAHGLEWTRPQRQQIEWFCKEVGNISFKELKKNFPKVVNTVGKLDTFGYLDWVVV